MVVSGEAVIATNSLSCAKSIVTLFIQILRREIQTFRSNAHFDELLVRVTLVWENNGFDTIARKIY